MIRSILHNVRFNLAKHKISYGCILILLTILFCSLGGFYADQKKAEKKVSRWQEIARSAKQGKAKMEFIVHQNG